jgi:CRISPR/Cas system-associated exonuclease Cas4 (RecB family)
MGKRSKSKVTDVLSASEIGQYLYCSRAWQLHRMGYEPESPSLAPGKQAHVALGDRLDGFETRLHYSRWYTAVGLILLCASILLFMFGVIL